MTTTHKLLVPLASLLAAGAIAVGSGASFTSFSQNAGNSFSTGTVKQTNSRADQAVFDLSNLKPGDSVVNHVSIRNSGTLPSAFTLTEAVGQVPAGGTALDPRYLTLTVTDSTRGAVVYQGQLGGLGTAPVTGAAATAWAADENHDFTFTVAMAADAPNSQQGGTAVSTYTWDAVQTDAAAFVDVTGAADQS